LAEIKVLRDVADSVWPDALLAFGISTTACFCTGHVDEAEDIQIDVPIPVLLEACVSKVYGSEECSAES